MSAKTATAQPALDAGTLRRVEVFYAGLNMLRSESDEEPTLRAVVWRLFQEAMQTQRAIKKPGPAPVRSSMPEVYHTKGEIFATEVAMAADKISYAPQIAHVANAVEIERYEEVMTWLRFIRARNVPRAQRLVLAMARGLPADRAADVFGFRNARAADAARYRAVSSIMERLKRDLPGEFGG